MHGPNDSSWSTMQASFAQSSARLFDHFAGDEVQVFHSIMGLLSECFDDQVLRQITTLQNRVVVGMTGQAYQLLVSCWEDLRNGRAASALDHWRSLWELPDYMIAAALNADFADAWSDRSRPQTIRPANARKIVVTLMNDKKRGEGDEWQRNRLSHRALFQPMSHVSSQAAGLTMLTVGPNGAATFAAPQGYYADSQRVYAINTVFLALDVLIATTVAFAPFVDGHWNDRVTETVRSSSTDLADALSQTDASVGHSSTSRS